MSCERATPVLATVGRSGGWRLLGHGPTVGLFGSGWADRRVREIRLVRVDETTAVLLHVTGGPVGRVSVPIAGRSPSCTHVHPRGVTCRACSSSTAGAMSIAICAVLTSVAGTASVDQVCVASSLPMLLLVGYVGHCCRCCPWLCVSSLLMSFLAKAVLVVVVKALKCHPTMLATMVWMSPDAAELTALVDVLLLVDTGTSPLPSGIVTAGPTGSRVATARPLHRGPALVRRTQSH